MGYIICMDAALLKMLDTIIDALENSSSISDGHLAAIHIARKALIENVPHLPTNIVVRYTGTTPELPVHLPELG